MPKFVKMGNTKDHQSWPKFITHHNPVLALGSMPTSQCTARDPWAGSTHQGNKDSQVTQRNYFIFTWVPTESQREMPLVNYLKPGSWRLLLPLTMEKTARELCSHTNRKKILDNLQSHNFSSIHQIAEVVWQQSKLNCKEWQAPTRHTNCFTIGGAPKEEATTAKIDKKTTKMNKF